MKIQFVDHRFLFIITTRNNGYSATQEPLRALFLFLKKTDFSARRRYCRKSNSLLLSLSYILILYPYLISKKKEVRKEKNQTRGIQRD